MDEHEQTETAPRPSFWKRDRKALLWATAALVVLGFGVVFAKDLITKHYDESARQHGRWAKLAEEPGFSDRPATPIPYHDNLADLLSYDKNLTEDPEVTFSFGTCNTSGYTFTTTHKRGHKTFLFTEELTGN